MLQFHVAISCCNTSSRLRQTLESLRNQTYSNFDLTIVDACSSDEFDAIIKEYASIINRVIIEEDDGLYDGLSKAFSIDRGEGIYCYINAGDLYMPYAFEAVCNAFEDSGCDWLTGLAAHRNSSQYLFDVLKPWPYSRILIQMGFYDGKLLPIVQQESTFWSYRLQRLIDLNAFRNFKLAGDFYLWNVFAHSSNLRILNVVVSSFTFHGGHLSDSKRKYYAEIDTILCSGRIYKFIFCLPALIVGLLMRTTRISPHIYRRLAGVI